MLPASLPSSYVCDTLPAARLASGSSDPESSTSRSPSPPSTFEVTEEIETDKMGVVALPEIIEEKSPAAPSQPAARKLCVRHQRMADEGTNLKLQQVSIKFVYTQGTGQGSR